MPTHFVRRLSVIRRSVFPLAASLVLAALLLPGCGKKDEESYTPGTFTAVYNQTLKTACIECHVPSGAATVDSHVDLDFSSASAAYTSLTTQYATGDSTPASCTTVKVVDPGYPQNSYLAGVLLSSYNTNDFAGKTGCQPYTAHLIDQHLSADEQSSLISWIQGGALNN